MCCTYKYVAPILLCTEFLQFALNQEEMRQKWLASVQECQRLHSALDKAHNEIADFDRKLRHARRNLEEENRKRRAVEEQRDYLVAFISLEILVLIFNSKYSHLYIVF